MRKVFQIERLPDLSLSKYQTLSDTGVEGVLERHNTFLRQWNRICQLNSLSMHLLFTFTPTLAVGQRLEIFFILQGEKKNVEAAAGILEYSPLCDYYTFKNVQEEKCIKKFEACTTLIKRERTVPVMVGENEIEQFYFVPEWSVSKNARMYDLCRMMEAISKSVSDGSNSAYRIDLYPIDIGLETRQIFKKPLAVLRKTMGYSNDKVSLSDNYRREVRDESAYDIVNQLEGWVKKLETTPHFRANIYGFSDSLVHAKMILGTAGSEAVEEGDYNLLKIAADVNGFDSFTRMHQEPYDYCTAEGVRKKWEGMQSWSTTFTCEEVGPFFRLPALFEGENVEVLKETMPEVNGTGMFLGRDLNGYDVKFPFENMPKHAMISGVPGAGKTNTMLHIISYLWKQNREERIPFLVFEPAKKEYRGLFNDPAMRDVLLFSPKMNSKFPLRINPFEFPRGMILSEHINILMSVFSGAFELIGATYYFLDKSIERAYVEQGWKIDTVNEGELPYPTIADVYAVLEKEINTSDYEAEIRGNFKSFLQVRLGGLMRRDAGQIFNNPFSTLSPDEWIKLPVIIELEALGEQDKNFLILLLCSLIRESLRMNPNGDVGKKVRHAIFIEEAHNIISNTTQQSSSESVNPKVSATAYIVKMLAEVRALREAIFITDQLPSVLAPEVLKNTGLKIVHRLTAQDDRAEIGATMSASEMQIDELVTYGNGEALLFYEKLQKPFRVKMCQWGYEGAPEGKNAGERYVCKTDDELFTLLYNNEERFSELINQDMYQKAMVFVNTRLFPFLDNVVKLEQELQDKKKKWEKSEGDLTTLEGEEQRQSVEKERMKIRKEKYIMKGEELKQQLKEHMECMIGDPENDLEEYFSFLEQIIEKIENM